MPFIDRHVIFKIPIYREYREVFYDNLEMERNGIVRSQIDNNPGLYEDYYSDPDNLPNINPKKISWKYNRIIGWVELHNHFKTIKADLWRIRLERVPKNFNPNYFDFKGKIADVCATHSLNNDEIKACIIKFFENLQKGKYNCSWVKKFYIDTSLLIKQLECLDIKKMIANES